MKSLHLTSSDILQIVPISAITFVVLLLFYKIYFNIRSRFNVLVNCWFCNQNTKVPYQDKNSWTCPYSECHQYNGFTKDGGYNREIMEQLDSSKNMQSCIYTKEDLNSSEILNSSSYFNGFCNDCNENQRLKVEKLSQFEPKNEKKFDDELEKFRRYLEKLYRLCPTCERHLSKILREKKKMVLGSKLLDFISKGVDTLNRHPKLQLTKNDKKSKLKMLISFLILILAIINFCFLINNLTVIIKNGFGKEFTNPIAHFILVIISYTFAIGNVVQTYLISIFKHEFIQKSYLFVKTILFFILQLFGIRVPKELFDFHNWFSIGIPFGSILLSFFQNILDGFRLSKYTVLLTVWSVYAGAINTDIFGSAEVFKLIASIAAIILSWPKNNSYDISMDAANNSFHKIYSENHLMDDEDSYSLLSSNQNNSMNSVKSFGSRITNKSHSSLSPCGSKIYTSSTLNLNKDISPSSHISPFKRFTICDDYEGLSSRTFTPITQYPARSLFASNLELNSPSLKHNNSMHNSSFCCTTKKPFSSINDNLNRNFNVWNQVSDNLLETRSKYCESINNYHENKSIHSQCAVNCRPSLINSPFSYSGSNILNQSRPNLLSPSRLSTTSTRYGSQPSWISGGFFNNSKPNISTMANKNNCFLNLTSPLSNNEHISRGSSQSSGFESHASSLQPSCGNNNNFEKNIGPRNSDYNNYGLHSPFINSVQSSCSVYNHGSADRFNEAIFSGSQITPSQSPSLQNLNSSYYAAMSRPLSVDCTDGAEDWRQKSMQRERFCNGNSFNLNKINEELGPIQRGSLLRKWKEKNCI